MNEDKCLPEKIKKYYQIRFRHYLKTYRQRKEMSQTILAKTLGYTESHIRKFEGQSSNNRLLKSLEFIHNFAILENLTIKEFIEYLDNTPIENEGKSRKFYFWEKTVLSILRQIDLNIRRSFVSSVLEKNKDNINKINDLLSLMITVNHLDHEDLQLLIGLSSKLAAKKKVHE